MKITKERNSKGEIKFFIKHNLINGALGEYFDSLYSAEKRLNELKQKEISPCPSCHCMTKSIRLGRAKYICGKCKADKSLSDVFYYEATHKGETNDN